MFLTNLFILIPDKRNDIAIASLATGIQNTQGLTFCNLPESCCVLYYQG